MADIQLEDGYTKIANGLMDKLCGFRFPAQVRSIVDVIFRKTYGWNKKRDKISLSQFEELTGMGKTNCHRALKLAIEHNVILRDNNYVQIQKDTDYWIPFNYNNELRFSRSNVISQDNSSKILPLRITAITSQDNKTLSPRITTKEKKDTIQKKQYIYKGEFKNIKLTSEQLQKLIDRFGKESTNNRIETMSAYCQSKGKTYKDYYAALLSWDKKDQRDNKGGTNGKPQQGGLPTVYVRPEDEDAEYRAKVNGR